MINGFFSLHVPRLPLIFVIAMSSSPALSPSYLHLTYPRSTLALLNVHNFTVPSGPEVLYKILYKVCVTPKPIRDAVWN